MGQFNGAVALRNSTTLEIDAKKGLTGTIVYICDREDVINNNNLPQIGDVFGAGWPTLLLVNIKVKEIEADQCELTCTYSAEGNNTTIDGFVERNLEFSVEVMDTTKGMKWEDSDSPVDIPVSTLHPMCDYTLTMKCATSPITAIWETQGKINDREFHDAPSGTLLFIGASIKESYDSNRVQTSTMTTYKFTKRDRDYNYCWAEPRQKMIDGIPQFDPVTSVPIYVDGVDGTGRWVKAYNTATLPLTGKSYRYEYADFATDLNLSQFDTTP